jgi:glutathione S-transferase
MHEDMIELHQFPPMWGINPSPFCLKVETYLRLAGLAFRPVTAVPMRAPKGKLPFIVDNGRSVADSGHIIEYLQRTYPRPLDEQLNQDQRALGHLMRRTCEESLYFVLLYSRWLDEPGWTAIRANFFATLPAPVRAPVSRFARRSIERALHAQGYGRHTRDELYSLGAADLEALAKVLGQRHFAVADQPSSFDATVYASLVNVIRAPLDTLLRASALAHPELAAYVDRMAAELDSR